MCARTWLTTTGGRCPDAGLVALHPKTAVPSARHHKLCTSQLSLMRVLHLISLVSCCTTSATSGKHAPAACQHLQQPPTVAAAPHKAPQGLGTVCFATPLAGPLAHAAPLASARLRACLNTGVHRPQLRTGPHGPTLLHVCRQHYSAERMSLVVMGGESLEQLEGWVWELFTPVSSGQLQRPTFFGAGMPFEVRSLQAGVLRDGNEVH